MRAPLTIVCRLASRCAQSDRDCPAHAPAEIRGAGTAHIGQDDAAATAYAEAAQLVTNFASTLRPEDSASLLASSAVRDLMRAKT